MLGLACTSRRGEWEEDRRLLGALKRSTLHSERSFSKGQKTVYSRWGGGACPPAGPAHLGTSHPQGSHGGRPTTCWLCAASQSPGQTPLLATIQSVTLVAPPPQVLVAVLCPHQVEEGWARGWQMIPGQGICSGYLCVCPRMLCLARDTSYRLAIKDSTAEAK